MEFLTEPKQALVTITVLLLTLLAQAKYSIAETHFLYWEVVTKEFTRNCGSVNITTVNGMYPGPVVNITEGDTVVVNVTNMQEYPVTIHWHGIFQFMTNWADGPAHFTQCSLKTGNSQIYEFIVSGQSGTFFWHAHNNWLRATMFGAFIVHPRDPPPNYGVEVAGEFSMISGEWFDTQPNDVEMGYLYRPIPVDTSKTANTLNGLTGPLYNCTPDDVPETQVFRVQNGSTYLLRLTNAGLNNNHWFTVANHTLTVVSVDGNYVKPFATDAVLIAPGQTTDVLLTANQTIGSYYGGVGLAQIPQVGPPLEAREALAIIEYEGAPADFPLSTPPFPAPSDPMVVDDYTAKVLGYTDMDLPETMDHNLVYVVGIALVDCIPSEPCTSTQKLAGTVQNFTFDEPQNSSVLEAYFYNISGVYETGFPELPPEFIDFTGRPSPEYGIGSRATLVKELEFNQTVELVLQNVNAAVMLDHPFHLHGHDFYVVGRNYGNFNQTTDPATFNLRDPPRFNTISVHSGGWVALRFRANNPGVWLLHCHFERHKT